MTRASAAHPTVPRPVTPRLAVALLPDVAPWIRPARPADRALIEAMHRRCSPASRYHRWHAPLPTVPAGYLAEALAGSARHLALVAVCGGQIVALASAVAVENALWELGILVEDRYQRRGLGSALVAALLGRLPAGPGCLQADLLAEQAWLLRQLGRLGRVRVDWTDEVVHARIEPGR